MEEWPCWTPVSMVRNCSGSALGIGLKNDSKAFFLSADLLPCSLAETDSWPEQLKQAFSIQSHGILLLEIHIHLSVIRQPECAARGSELTNGAVLAQGNFLTWRILALTLCADSF